MDAVLRRLRRAVPMQKGWELPKMVHRAFAREEEREALVKPIQVREAFKLDVRTLRVGVEAGPNAPQMIRLIRQPYGLLPSGMKREAAAARARPEPRPGLEAREGMTAAMEVASISPWPRASRARYRNVPRPRLGSQDWSAWYAAEEGKE